LCLAVETRTNLQKAAATCAKKKRKAKMQSTTKMSKDKESEKLSLEKATKKVRQAKVKAKETMPRAQTDVKHHPGLKSQTSQNVKASKKTKEGRAQLSTRKNDRPWEKKTSEGRVAPTSARLSKAATELHKRWLNEAEKMGGVDTKVTLSKPKAQEAIAQALEDAFRPMNITALHKVR
jgi:hypothetical protein